MLINLAKNKQINETIIKNKIDMKIFQSIKINDPSIKNLLRDSIPLDIIENVVEFLKNIVVGNEDHETIFAQILKEDIIILSKK